MSDPGMTTAGVGSAMVAVGVTGGVTGAVTAGVMGVMTSNGVALAKYLV